MQDPKAEAETSRFNGAHLALGATSVLAGVGLAGFVAANAVYTKCPPNKLLVIYGRGVEGRGISSGMRIIKKGGGTVFPMLQDSRFLSLEPMAMEIPLKGALSLEKIRVNVPSVFTVAISTEEQIAMNAARRLLGMNREQMENQAEEVIVGQMRQVLAGLTIEEINRDREKFVTQVQEHCCVELGKLGLELLNTNVQNITDESGVIDELGRKAAAEVKQQAQIDVATQEKKGAIGVSQQEKDKDIFVGNNRKERDVGVREADREARTRIEELEAEELQAVNLARQKKTESDATLAIAKAGFQKQAEIALKEAEAAIVEADANAKTRAALAHAKQVEAETRARLEAEAKVHKSKRILEAEAKAAEIDILTQAEASRAKVQKIKTVLEAEAKAEAEAAEIEILAQAEASRAKVEKSKIILEAEAKAEGFNILTQAEASRAEVEKSKTILDAEAKAEEISILSQAEANRVFTLAKAAARGNATGLKEKAEALKAVVDACGGSEDAYRMLLLEHLDKLAETSATAISNIKFDKVVVWDNGSNGSEHGAIPGFIKDVTTALPPTLDVIEDIVGVDLKAGFKKSGKINTKPEPPARHDSISAKEADKLTRDR